MTLAITFGAVVLTVAGVAVLFAIDRYERKRFDRDLAALRERNPRGKGPGKKGESRE